MKRLLGWTLLFLLLAGWMLWLQPDPGYVLIRYHHWNVETTIGFALLAWMIFLLVIYALVRLLTLPSTLRRWRQRRQYTQSYRTMVRGICALIQGQWSIAERCFLKTVRHDRNTSFLPYLGAALAADAQRQPQRYRRYIAAASARAGTQGQDLIAVDCVQAWVEWQRSTSSPLTLLVRLERMQQQCPGHPYVLEALIPIYEAQASWEKLIALLPSLKQAPWLDPKDFMALSIRVYQHAWKARFAAPYQYAELATYWQQLPKLVRHHAALLVLYVQALAQIEAYNRAYRCIERHLKRHWEPCLVRAYGLIITTTAPDAPKSLIQAYKTADRWLKQHSQDAVLLLTLGRLCVALEQWDEAKQYLQQSLKKQPSLEAHRELATVLIRSGASGTPEALAYYREGLGLMLAEVDSSEVSSIP